MKAVFYIEYHTVWGENMRLRAMGKNYPMQYTPGDIWKVEIGGLKSGRNFGYRYEVEKDGICVKAEWKSHNIFVPSKAKDAVNCNNSHVTCAENTKDTIEVRDFWSDVPEDLPLHSAPFADGVFRTEPGKTWKAAGTAIPVFSLRSEKSFGVGEFCDIRLLADWAAMTGQKVLQLLPVNDTTMTDSWFDSYPYKANSIYALHPQFINLVEAGKEADEEYTELLAELNALPDVDYERVNLYKRTYLRELFARKGKKDLESEGFRKFFEENGYWLMPYAVFCCLRDKYRTADFSLWKGYEKYSEKKARKYCEEHPDEVGVWYFTQYHLHLQLADARAYARSKGVILKGDLPIGISRTSADAWLHPELFNLDSCAGAPPDAFSEDGQNWGLPTYNWEKMSEDDYAWWKERLANMAQYFDAFRIDHLLGFFRIWEIPYGISGGILGHFNPALPYREEELASLGFDMKDKRTALRGTYSGKTRKNTEGMEDVLFVEDRRKGFFHPRISASKTAAYAALPKELQEKFDRIHDDFFYHRHNAFWKGSALSKLPDLLASTGMLVCGEDLGMIPASVPEVMSELRILSLEIQRMPKTVGETFANPAWYPYLSVCTTSTHDMNPLRAWWNEDRQLTRRYWQEVMGKNGDAPEDCTPQVCREIIKAHLDSPAMLTILPLQDWLAMDGELRYGGDPADERINEPSDPDHYWHYRMHLTLEKLVAAGEFNSLVKSMISDSGRD